MEGMCLASPVSWSLFFSDGVIDAHFECFSFLLIAFHDQVGPNPLRSTGILREFHFLCSLYCLCDKM